MCTTRGGTSEEKREETRPVTGRVLAELPTAVSQYLTTSRTQTLYIYIYIYIYTYMYIVIILTYRRAHNRSLRFYLNLAQTYETYYSPRSSDRRRLSIPPSSCALVRASWQRNGRESPYVPKSTSYGNFYRSNVLADRDTVYPSCPCK